MSSPGRQRSASRETPDQVEIDLGFLCNQIIHSFVWWLSVTEDKSLFDGIYVPSDRERRWHLYFFSAALLIDLFREVGEEDNVEMSMTTNASGERYISRVVSATDRANGIALVDPAIMVLPAATAQ